MSGEVVEEENGDLNSSLIHSIHDSDLIRRTGSSSELLPLYQQSHCRYCIHVSSLLLSILTASRSKLLRRVSLTYMICSSHSVPLSHQSRPGTTDFNVPFLFSWNLRYKMDSGGIHSNRGDRGRSAVPVMECGPAWVDPRSILHHPHCSHDSHLCIPCLRLLQTS